MNQNDFDKIKLSQTIEARDGKSCRAFHSVLWQADPAKLHRMAPIEFIGDATQKKESGNVVIQVLPAVSNEYGQEVVLVVP